MPDTITIKGETLRMVNVLIGMSEKVSGYEDAIKYAVDEYYEYKIGE